MINRLKDLEAYSKNAHAAYEGFWNSGADDLVTLKENEQCFENYRIRARGFQDVSHIDMRPTKPLFGKQYSVPIVIGPSAQHDLATSEGELATARACESREWPMALSSFSGKSAEEVIEYGPNSNVFFQLYVFKNRDTTANLVKRVERAGYKALLVTIDTPYPGNRIADKVNQFTIPDYLERGNFKGVDLANPVEQRHGANQSENRLDSSITFANTIPWLKSITNMEVWVKGIMTAEDTDDAIQNGVDGIWVSNHGGRQLDSGLSTIEALPEVVDTCKGRVPIHFDGGVRRGGDVFKALALGADFVWVARPALWGLFYDGQNGVELMQDLLTKEFKLVMALSGCVQVDQIDKSRLIRVWPRPQILSLL